jgi:hypothetical protein
MSVAKPGILLLLPVFCAGIALLPHAAAQEPVYKWVDAAGNVTYSDQPPPSGHTAEQLQMPAAPSAEDAAAARQRSEALQRQADEMAQERRLREQRAAEAAKAAAVAAAQAEPAEQEDSSYNNAPYYNSWPAGPDRRPIVRPRPPGSVLPPRPVQPIARPVLPRR